MGSGQPEYIWTFSKALACAVSAKKESRHPSVFVYATGVWDAARAPAEQKQVVSVGFLQRAAAHMA